MISAISSGLEGYRQAEATVNNAAEQIAAGPGAQLNTGAQSSAADTVDLSDSMLSLLQGRLSAEANLSVVHTADQMQKSLIDLLG